MNAKNLWLRFLIVALLILFCIWPLMAGRGLRWGIDLQGGHSLIFEIRTNEAERDRLKELKDKLKLDLQAATDDERKQEISAQIARVEIDLKRYAEEDPGDLPQQMIALLKKRVDPNGLRSLEWRPLGKNRIEIRMPAGKGDTREKRDAYFAAMDRLEGNNVRRSEIRDVLHSSPDQRQEKIDLYTRGDQEQGRRFEALIKAYDELMHAESARDLAIAERKAALEKSKKPRNLEQLDESVSDAQAKFDNAQVRYEDALSEFEKGNINRQELHQALENYYLGQLQEKGLTGKAPGGKVRPFPADLVIEEIDATTAFFETSLQKLKQEHPGRVEEIDEVLERFKDWAEVRERLDDPADLVRLIAKAGVLEFRIAPLMPTSQSKANIKLTPDQYEQYVQSLTTEGPDGLRNRNARMQWFPVHGQTKPGKKRYILLYNQPGYQMLHETRGAWRLTKAWPDSDTMGRPGVKFNLNEAGASRMGKLTAAHQTHNMAILLDDEVYTAPVIKAIISKSGIIEGNFTDDEVNDLASILNAGSLPAKLNPNPISVNGFGPGIGKENRDRGYQAARWGLIIVAGFMLVYYLMAGVIADVALILNVILILGTMSWLKAVFTLPGIAGVILTIGIAVDANVLIFERLREEQAKNQSVRMALKNAYERAFSAIFDANITTLLTCLILGWVGTEEVRGFAITLGLGVMFSMFTSLLVTRWIFQALLDWRIIRKPIPMLRIIGVPGVNWLSKRYLFWGLSVLFVVMGIASLLRQGGDIWGIEFSSGTQTTITFRDDALLRDPSSGGMVPPNDALVRDQFKKVAGDLGYDKLQATANVETRLDPNRVGDFVRDYDDRSGPDGKVSLSEWLSAGMNREFFATIDTDNDETLSESELQEGLGPVSYQVSTTETDIERIRRVTREAFGANLQVRLELDYRKVAAREVAELAVTIPPDARLRVTPSLLRQIRADYREEFADLEGGALLVVEDVDPAITRSELVQRIRDMRAQPDYAGRIFSQTKVLGLTSAGEDKFSSFAVIVSPADTAMIETPGAWNGFVDGEWALLSDALVRGTAMPISNFDAAIAGETAQLAIIAVILSWLSIVIYLWFRFGSVQWGLAAVVCLIHDVVIVVGLVGASSWLTNTWIGQSLGIQSFKVDLAMVAAFLTVIGYSVNDTIVIFDRIRENRGKLKTVSGQVINASVNQTLSRTLLTTGTTFIVVVVMYVMGGPGLHAFNYALLVGILFGTYSSVAVASPLLMGFKRAVLTRVARSRGKEA